MSDPNQDRTEALPGLCGDEETAELAKESKGLWSRLADFFRRKRRIETDDQNIYPLF